jgi:hypothetical protein
MEDILLSISKPTKNFSFLNISAFIIQNTPYLCIGAASMCVSKRKRQINKIMRMRD